MKNTAQKVPALSVVKDQKKRSNSPKPKKVSKIKIARGISGAIFGSSASGIAYLTMHYSLVQAQEFSLKTACHGVVLLGCLLFSFPTAYEYFFRAFRSQYKAFGLVVLFELTMLSSNLPWLSVFAAFLLMAVNGVNAAINSMAKFETQEKNPF